MIGLSSQLWPPCGKLDLNILHGTPPPILTPKPTVTKEPPKDKRKYTSFEAIHARMRDRFDRMPDEFSVKDVITLLGIDPKTAANAVRRWREYEWCERTEKITNTRYFYYMFRKV